MTTDSASRYQRAGRQLDDHLRDCPLCSTGTACADGDAAADTEYRAWRAWRTDDPNAARSAQTRR
jgi:hypothetical protein